MAWIQQRIGSVLRWEHSLLPSLQLPLKICPDVAQGAAMGSGNQWNHCPCTCIDSRTGGGAFPLTPPSLSTPWCCIHAIPKCPPTLRGAFFTGVRHIVLQWEHRRQLTSLLQTILFCGWLAFSPHNNILNLKSVETEN